jgi:hypothetical protein
MPISRRRVRKLEGGRGDCKACGAPSYKNINWEVEPVVSVISTKEERDRIPEPERCPACGRAKAYIRVRPTHPEKPLKPELGSFFYRRGR